MSAIANSFKSGEYTGTHLCPNVIDNTKGWNQIVGNLVWCQIGEKNVLRFSLLVG